MSHGNHQDRLNESLSALMDGEANELELQRLLKSGSAGSEAGQRWSRYQLAASVMRGETVARTDTDLAARISAAVAREEPLQQSASESGAAANDAGHRWRQMLSRGAVAATVAFAAILGVQQVSQVSEPVPTPQLAAETERPAQQPAVQPAQQPSSIYVPGPSTRAVSTAGPRLVPAPKSGVPGQAALQPQVPTPELMRHLNRVMIQHSEQAAHVGSQGMVPFARATYGEQDGQ
ncbi:anti-sigma factor [Microbulbifer flavimaris]|uniref:Anti-sigma factor n=1 Tax=Microbulbifer flavimaris TaxID=1781068 RepID=A0ABX4I312_9GAMM|nr:MULTISPECIES: sigma-E factor negative regulatory protein [Microbulbifer]PCO06443.1 anti-sigma factor [Microbulbifer flavimaris]